MASTELITHYPWKSGKDMKAGQEGSHEMNITQMLQKLASRELREDEKSREQCLETFREWIRKNEDIKNIRNDDSFLLRFLRVKKFSVPMAQQTLLKYLNFRKKFRHLSHNLNVFDPALQEVINSGYIFPSPIRDKFGRRVIIMNPKLFNTDLYSNVEVAKAHLIIYETLLEQDENQILGLVHVCDFGGMPPKFIMQWNPTEFTRLLRWGEQSVPIRHKAIHLANIPQSIKWIVDYVVSRLSPKMKDRFQTHVTIDDMLKSVDTECLPKEMGGKLPMSEMVMDWKDQLHKCSDMLLSLDYMQILNDKGIIKKTNGSSLLEIDNLQGTFRKLDFD